MTHQVNAKWVEPMGSFKSQKKIPTWNLYLTAITEAAVAFINQLLSATFGIWYILSGYHTYTERKRRQAVSEQEHQACRDRGW